MTNPTTNPPVTPNFALSRVRRTGRRDRMEPEHQVHREQALQPIAAPAPASSPVAQADGQAPRMDWALFANRLEQSINLEPEDNKNDQTDRDHKSPGPSPNR